MKTEKQQSVAAAACAKKWEGRGYEKGESQIFWTELLTEVMYGAQNEAYKCPLSEKIVNDLCLS